MVAPRWRDAGLGPGCRRALPPLNQFVGICRDRGEAMVAVPSANAGFAPSMARISRDTCAYRLQVATETMPAAEGTAPFAAHWRSKGENLHDEVDCLGRGTGFCAGRLFRRHPSASDSAVASFAQPGAWSGHSALAGALGRLLPRADVPCGDSRSVGLVAEPVPWGGA